MFSLKSSLMPAIWGLLPYSGLMCCDVSLTPGAAPGFDSACWAHHCPCLLSWQEHDCGFSKKFSVAVCTASPAWPFLYWYLLSLDVWHSRLYMPVVQEPCFVIYFCHPGIWGLAQSMLSTHILKMNLVELNSWSFLQLHLSASVLCAGWPSGQEPKV